MRPDIKRVKEVRGRIRYEVWSRLMREGVARFPLPVYGRIPNFAGAELAASRLTGCEAFKSAKVVKVSPDSPQRPVRLAVLRAGKLLVMPTPRIRRGFLLIDPEGIPENLYESASTIKGAFRYGEVVSPESLPLIDLIVTGSVAVDRTGTRLGKGEGYSELEYAILREYGRVRHDTPIYTTVHDIQLIDQVIPRLPWDVSIDLAVTPTKIFKALGPKSRPDGILWEFLDERKIKEIPLLQILRRLKR